MKTLTATDRPVSLKEKAYEDIKRLILEGDLRPGALLSERSLGRQMGVSGSPIRSALERLRGEGLVKVSPQRGTVVCDLSCEEIADQFEFRMVLEAYVVRQLAGLLNESQRDRLTKQLARQEAAALAAQPDILLNAELDAEFHLLLCEFLGNQEMKASLERIRDQIKRAILRVNWWHEERLPQCYREHAAIVAAILDAQGELASMEMCRHLEYGRDFLLSGGGDS